MDDSSSEEDFRAEEIYDLDTATLREKLRHISEELATEPDFAKKEKLVKFADIIALEIEERTLALDFEENCERILGSLEEVVENVDLMIERNRNMFLEPQNLSNEIEDKHSLQSKQKNRVILPPIDPDRLMSPSVQTDLVHNTSRLSRSTSNSRAITSTQCSDYRIAGKFDAVDEQYPPSRLYPRRQGGKAGWLDFVKNTLNTTKVQNQVLSVGQGVLKKPPKAIQSDEIRTSRSRERVERKHQVNPHTLQLELKKKMREATKAYGESLRKRNQTDRKNVLEEDSGTYMEGHELETTKQQDDLDQKETKGPYYHQNKPPSISSFNSTDHKYSNQSRKNNIRVSSNSSIPYVGHQLQTKGIKKAAQLESSNKFREGVRGKSSHIVSKNEPKDKKRKLSEEKKINLIFPIAPEFDLKHPTIDHLELWKKEEATYISKINNPHPLEPLEHLFLQICHQYCSKIPRKTEVKTATTPQTSTQRSKSKSSREHTTKETIKGKPDSTQTQVPKEAPQNKKTHNGKNTENDQRHTGLNKKNELKKDPPAANKPLVKTKTQKELKRTETKDSLKQVEPKNENFPINSPSSRDHPDEVNEVHPIAKPSVPERIPKLPKKSSRREDLGTEEQQELDEKRAKINNQIEIWKATKGVPAQMRSTADLRSLLPAPLDYSDSVPTWGHLFSETYCHKQNQEADILGAMRDVSSVH